MLRYSKLTDPQVLANLLIVCDKEKVAYSDDGMEAIVFTAQGKYSNLNQNILYIATVKYPKIKTKCIKSPQILFRLQEI